MPEALPSAAPTGTPALSEFESRPRRPFVAATSSKLWVAAGILGAVAITATAAFLHQHPTVSSPPSSHTVVVLPVVNLTGDPQRNYLADGITVETIARLSGEDPEAVHVIARTSAMSFRNSTQPIRQIGEALGADYLLESSLSGDEQQIHLIAQLVRASDQTQVWSRSYIGPSQHLQEFENDIADRSAESLTGHRPASAPPQQTVVTASAHDSYLKGLSAIGQRSRQGFENAMLYFGDALQKEPRYAEAYAELAVTYNLMGQYNWMRQEEARSQGRAAALQALALDPTLPEARAALGFSYWFYDWNNQSALQELTSAVAREPNNADTHHWLAMVLLTSARLDQAELEMRAALALDPASPILKTNLGWVHYMQHRFPLAVQEMTAVTRQNPEFLSAHFKLIPAAFLMGDQRRAWQESKAMLQDESDRGLLDRANREFERAGYAAALKTIVQSPSNDSYSRQTDRARDLMLAGDAAGAVGTLQDGLRHHDSWMIFVPIDPAFAPLRDDPRFRQIVQAVQHSPVEVARTP